MNSVDKSNFVYTFDREYENLPGEYSENKGKLFYPGSTMKLNPAQDNGRNKARTMKMRVITRSGAEYLIPALPEEYYEDDEGQYFPLPAPHITVESKRSKRFLTWTMPGLEIGCNDVEMYEIYCYDEPLGEKVDDNGTDKWELLGRRKAMALPMEFPLTRMKARRKYFFSIRAVDAHHRVGPFSNVSTVTVGKKRENQSTPEHTASSSVKSYSGENEVEPKRYNKDEQNLGRSGLDETIFNGRNQPSIGTEMAKISARFSDIVAIATPSIFRISSRLKNPFFRGPKKVSLRRFMRDLALSPNLQNGAIVCVNLVESYRILTVNAKEDEEALVDLLQKIQKHASQAAGFQRVPHLNEIAVAPYGDGFFYRARVTEVVGEMVTVEFVDYGDRRTMHYVGLKELNPDICDVPIYGAKFILKGIPEGMLFLPEIDGNEPVEGQIEILETNDDGMWVGNLWLLGQDEDCTWNEVIRSAVGFQK